MCLIFRLNTQSGLEEVIITIIPPLKKFCEDCLAVEHIHLNPYRKEVFEETLRLIETYKTESYKEMFNGTNLNNLSKYFGEHVGYYWD